eukprot:scaffold10.g2409.t1
MRRRPGIQGLQRTQAARDQFKALGEQVAQTKLELMRAQMATFKTSLEEFALRYRADIRRDPVFRAQFHTMCANIGVDPLASNKGTWNKLLGFGDFYYEIGVQVVEACLTTRPYTGGLLELNSEDDLLRAIDKLAVLGGGFAVVTIGARRFVRSVPTQLSTDANRLIEVAQLHRAHRVQGLGGFMTLADAVANIGWAEARVRDALGAMLSEGLLLVDDPPPSSSRGAGAGSTGGRAEQLYWVPALGMEWGTEQYLQREGRQQGGQQGAQQGGGAVVPLMI